MISFQRLCRKTMMCLGNTLPNSSTRQAPRRWISSDAMGTYSCQVIISKASCIYDNLALEDWLYEKTGSELNQRRLLMWRSSPCVVIGKFQNQWQECNYHALGEHRVKLARRKSGGGTVYHDRGNINLSFITHREKYNRRENLDFICNALTSTWPHLNLHVTDRDDILLDAKYKISGTAAKLSRNKAYHHCTLLVESDRQILKSCLDSPIKDQITTNASASVPAPTSSISSPEQPIKPEDVVQCMAEHFVDKYAENKTTSQISTVDEVNLCDLTYPGLGDIKYELSSFQWIYGRTPKFTVSHNITSGEILTIEVEKGHIKTISVQNENKTSSDITGTLAGLPFCPVTIPSIIKQNKLTVQADNLYCNDILDLFEKIKFGA